MIEFDKETLKLFKSYTPDKKNVILFDKMKIDFHKGGKRDFLSWHHPGHNYGSPYGIAISHKGKLTWHSIKRTLEMHLNYHNSHLRKAIIKNLL